MTETTTVSDTQAVEPEETLLWIDLETTGLEDDADILEMGLVLTSMDAGEIYAAFSRVYCPIYPDDTVLALLMDEAALAMHTDNGLIDAMRRVHESAPTQPWAPILDLEAFCNRHIASHNRKAYPAGSSVHYDMAHINQTIRTTRERYSTFQTQFDGLSHQHMDVTSLRLAMQTANLSQHIDYAIASTLNDKQTIAAFARTGQFRHFGQTHRVASCLARDIAYYKTVIHTLQQTDVTTRYVTTPEAIPTGKVQA